MRSKRTSAQLALGMGLVIVAGSLLAGCQAVPPQTEALEPIRYAGQYYPEEFLLKAYPEFWQAYGITVEHILFSSGTENNQALISGQADINVGSDSKTVALFNAIPDQALVIGIVQRGDRYSTMVRPDSPYQSWEDLKGKTVATRLGTGAEQVLRRYFEREGLNWDDFDWVDINVEDMPAALDGKTIEAFTAWEPTPAIAEAQGIGRVLLSYGDVALVPVCIHTTVDYASTHHEEIVRFLAAHLDKVAMIQDDPQRAAELAAQAASAQGVEVSPAAFLKVFQRIDFSMDIDEDILAAIQDTAQFLYDQGQISAIPQIRWDMSFLEEAKELRGTK
jgi:ABC-type nitrate/sulfonate/bicarbonate transport system substrate-binding protein